MILLVLNALVGTFISDYCWGKSVILLGPFITTLGVTSTFPLSAIFETLAYGKEFSLKYLVGSLLIFTAFGVMVVAEYFRKAEQSKE